MNRAPVVGSLVAGVAACALLVAALMGKGTPAHATEEGVAPNATATATAPTSASDPAPAPAPAPTPVLAPAPALTPSALEQTIHDAEPLAAREAIVAAVDAKDLSALPVLEKVDLSKDGFVAAAAIEGVGNLGAIADPSDQRLATQTLDRWLRDETKRGTPDAIGNASIAIDALHDLGTPESADALIAALDSASEPLHLETRLVQTLDAMHAQSAMSAITRFEARVRTRIAADDLETALIAEAIAAAETALADLH
jgi:HEAT repeat protein